MKRARFRPRLAIATGHKPDDDYTIPAAERKIRADYQMERGPLPGGQRSRAAGRAVFLVKGGPSCPQPATVSRRCGILHGKTPAPR
jgi:hypothetical protein